MDFKWEIRHIRQLNNGSASKYILSQGSRSLKSMPWAESYALELLKFQEGIDPFFKEECENFSETISPKLSQI